MGGDGRLAGTRGGFLSGLDRVATADTQGITAGPGGLRARRLVPDTNAEFEAATTLTSAAWWRADKANSANLASRGDVSATLVKHGAPTYQVLQSGRTGIATPGAGGLTDNFSADVLAPAANSFIGGGSYSLHADPAGAAHNIVGRFKTGAPPAGVGWLFYLNDSGDLIYDIQDGTTEYTGTLASALSPVGAEPVDLGFQVDRSLAASAHPLLRAMWARDGALIGEATVTLTGMGTRTLSASGQEFGFAAIPDSAPGFYAGVAWHDLWFFAIGTQAEGATKLADVGRGLGWRA